MHILFFMATLAIYPRVFLDSNLLFFLITALVGILAMHCRITLGTHIVSSLVGVVKLDSRNPATGEGRNPCFLRLGAGGAHFREDKC